MASDQKPWWRQAAGRPRFAEGDRGARVSLALVVVSSAVVLATGPPAWLTIVALAVVVVASVGLARRP